MTTNTINDFINTRDSLPIYCPACGAKMTLHNPATYEMQLTDNAQREIDKIIQEYRIFLGNIERNLRLRNRGETKKSKIEKYDLEPLSNTSIQEGLFKHEDFTGLIYSRFDPLAIERQIALLPTLQELRTSENDKKREELDSKTVKFLLHFIELSSLIDPIITLLLEQEDLLNWRQVKDVKIDKGVLSSSSLLEGNLKSNFWIQYFREVTRASLQKGAVQGDLEKRIIRSVYILALMFGHTDPKLVKDMPNIFVGGAAYDLPRRVIVSAATLDELLRSKVIFDMRDKFGLSKDFVDYVSAIKDESEAPIDKPFGPYSDLGQVNLKGEDLPLATIPTGIESFLDQEISKLVKFTCVSPSTILLDSTQTQDNNQAFTNNRSSQDIHRQPNLGRILENAAVPNCGWYPKDEQTHSVVLLGSPGTGKSTVMETSLTILRLISSGMGINLVPLSIDEYALNTEYTTNFWSGILPQPTEVNTRSSIQFRTESTFPEGEQIKKSYFVFTDIPGETAIRHLLDRKKPMHPFITSVLSSTETIVFFFDLTADPEIRNMLLNSDSEEWEPIANHVQDTKAARDGSVADVPQKASDSKTGKAMYDWHKVDIVQTDLMMTFIEELRKIRGDGLKGISFLCVFPKMDLFIDSEAISSKSHSSNSKSRKFLTPFYKYLIDSGLLTEPISSNAQSEDEGNFARTSIGIYGLKNPDLINLNGKALLDMQSKQFREISDMAIKSLSEIGNALSEKSSSGWKNTLSSKIHKGVIETLETHFGKENVYFLPISPQGNEYRLNTFKEQDGIKKIEHPPYQKLSEYVLGIPVILATLRDWYPELEQWTQPSRLDPGSERGSLETTEPSLQQNSIETKSSFDSMSHSSSRRLWKK